MTWCGAGAATMSADPCVRPRTPRSSSAGRSLTLGGTLSRPWTRLLPWPEGAVVAPPARCRLSRREGRSQSVVDGRGGGCHNTVSGASRGGRRGPDTPADTSHTVQPRNASRHSRPLHRGGGSALPHTHGPLTESCRCYRRPSTSRRDGQRVTARGGDVTAGRAAASGPATHILCQAGTQDLKQGNSRNV